MTIGNDHWQEAFIDYRLDVKQQLTRSIHRPGYVHYIILAFKYVGGEGATPTTCSVPQNAASRLRG